MKYLQLLDTIRAITGRRRFDRFPQVEPSVITFRSETQPATFLVHDAQQAKAVLQSPRYEQFNFLSQVLTIAKPDRTEWIRRFCEIGLIMVDGPEHQRRRLLMQQALDRCAVGVKQISEDELHAAVEDGLGADQCTADGIASRLVLLLFSRSIAALSGSAVELDPVDLFSIDFFNPFPTLSSLSRCNDSIGKCCRAIGFESLDESGQAAVLSLLLMGVGPLHAIITALLNDYIGGRREGLAAEAAVKRTLQVDSYAIVPTNFVMRVCVAADTLGMEVVRPGDIVYLFLGAATGCPFTRLTSLPFGAGQHYCSGAALTQVMINAVRSVLGRVEADWREIRPSTEVQGKAAAFLSFKPVG